ncbi:hypothetical protein L1987_37361 [Smallanthus sonchifolius]|uniref:Uncharacterized protein n=1 Tax=Smallanthus sonchifolius TaxID=185202 RepID=A0ACB9HHJ4_9ASTR|nr:hypothetical protein L1987_37361 [Smallanthus sonchifolius]
MEALTCSIHSDVGSNRTVAAPILWRITSVTGIGVSTILILAKPSTPWQTSRQGQILIKLEKVHFRVRRCSLVLRVCKYLLSADNKYYYFVRLMGQNS